MIHSNLSYCINIYGCASKTSLNPLILKQKQAIRTISKVGYREHTGPLFSNLKILSLEKMITYYHIKFMQNYHFKKLPLSFANMWPTNEELNPGRNLRNAEDLHIQPHRVELVKKMPLYSFPLAWNNAPADKLNPIQHLYMKSLKSVLLTTPPNL